MRHRASVICIEAHRMLMVELIDFTNGQKFWVPPGGKVEPGESAAEAACRETFEETGARVSVWPETLLSVDYAFTWMGNVIECRTDFFLATYLGTRDRAFPLDGEDYILQSKWVDLDDVLNVLVDIPEIQRAISSLIMQYQEIEE